MIVKFPAGTEDQCVSIGVSTLPPGPVTGKPIFTFCLQGKVYVFDKVLKSNVSQAQVYDATAKNIVKGDEILPSPA